MAVERVREGEDPRAVIASVRILSHYYLQVDARVEWTRQGHARARLAQGGRPRTRLRRRSDRCFAGSAAKDPRQYGFDFGLWTRQIVGVLIKQKFRVRLGVTAVGMLLAKLGLTPRSHCNGHTNATRKPLPGGNTKSIHAWPRTPRHARRADHSGDESGFRADAVRGKTWGVRAKRRWWPFWAATIDVGSLGDQCPRRLLVCDLPRGAQR